VVYLAVGRPKLALTEPARLFVAVDGADVGEELLTLTRFVS